MPCWNCWVWCQDVGDMFSTFDFISQAFLWVVFLTYDYRQISRKHQEKLPRFPHWCTKGLCIWTRKHEQWRCSLRSNCRNKGIQFMRRFCQCFKSARCKLCSLRTVRAQSFGWLRDPIQNTFVRFNVWVSRSCLTSLFIPCLASPAIPSATFNGGAVNGCSTLVSVLLRFRKNNLASAASKRCRLRKSHPPSNFHYRKGWLVCSTEWFPVQIYNGKKGLCTVSL